MAFVYKDRVAEAWTGTGTGNITPAGAANSTYQDFSSVMASGDTTDIAIFGSGDFETCPATWNGTQLVRGTPYESSNGGAAVNFGVGGKTVVMCMPAAIGLRASDVTTNTGGLINKFRNSALDIWNRGSSGSVSAGTPAYTADGWYVGCTGAAVTWARQAGRQLTAYSLQVVGATSVTDVFVKQRIESFLCFPLAGREVTFQGYVYNNSGGSITPTITVKRANATDNWSASTTDISAQNLQSCAHGTWTQVYYTFTANSGAGTGLEVTIDFGNNFSAGTKTVQVSEFDIRIARTVQAPELLPVTFETSRSARYVRAFIGNAIAVGYGYGTSSTAAFIPQLGGTPMRTAPSLVLSSASHFTIYPANIVATNIVVSGSGTAVSPALDITAASGLTFAQPSLLLSNTASASLILTSEL